MEQLSNLELLRLKEIVDNIKDIVVADDVGITWGLEDDLNEAKAMIEKAIKIKNE